MAMAQLQWKRRQYEKGYNWLFFHAGRSWWSGLLVALLVTGAGGSFYLWYHQSGSDIAPDSLVGLGYAIAGTACFVLAATFYTLQRRSPRRAVGQLNAALNWHVFFAIMGIALLFMHSFGNFNAKTGTYAFYGLVVLMVSGFVGRALDRIMPRLIAGEVDKSLTPEGEDRVEAMVWNLQSIAGHSIGGGNSLPPTSTFAQKQVFLSLPAASNSLFEVDDQAINTPWDLAYLSFGSKLPGAVHEEGGDSFLARKSVHPGVLMYQAQRQVEEIRRVQQAIEREQFYRCVIRYWRFFHLALALLSVGLIIWHLVYVAQLLVGPLLR